VIARCVSSKEL